MKTRAILVTGLGILLGAPLVASAHIALEFPTPRPVASIKKAPCGETGSTRGAVINVFEPGETITVAWDETVDHPGHYRISFDADGQDFTIPPGYNDDSASENVLVDLIPDLTGAPDYTQTITFPDIECENCTLQLIQMMTDKPPYTTDAASNDIYFQCADIALRVGGSTTPDAAPGTPDAAPGTAADAAGGGQSDGGGCQVGTSDNSPLGILAIVSVVALAMTQRRRRLHG